MSITFEEEVEFWQDELRAARNAGDEDAEYHAEKALKRLGVTV